MLNFIIEHYKEIVLCALGLFLVLNIAHILVKFEHQVFEFIFLSKKNPELRGEKSVNFSLKQDGIGYTKNQKIILYTLSSILFTAAFIAFAPTTPLAVALLLLAIIYPRVVFYLLFVVSGVLICIVGILGLIFIVTIVNPIEAIIKKKKEKSN